EATRARRWKRPLPRARSARPAAVRAHRAGDVERSAGQIVGVPRTCVDRSTRAGCSQRDRSAAMARAGAELRSQRAKALWAVTWLQPKTRFDGAAGGYRR